MDLKFIIELIKKVKPFIDKIRKKKNEEKNEKCIEIISKTMKSTLEKEYKGYIHKGYGSKKIIEDICLDFRISSLSDLKAAIDNGSFINAVRKREIINVIDKRLSNDYDDVNKFYDMFQNNLQKAVETHFVENERAYKRLGIQNDNKISKALDKNTDSIKEEINKSKVISLNTSASKLGLTLTWDVLKLTTI